MNKLKVTIFTLLLVLLLGSQILADFPVTVVDDFGYEITLEEKPERIISLAPSNTEMLFSLDLEDKIVGVTTFCDYPLEALQKEKIGSMYELNIEKIILLEPDIVVASSINRGEVAEKLKELGVKVIGFDPKNFDEITLNIIKLGKITGNKIEAEELVADIYFKYLKIKDLVSNALRVQQRPKVFYELWSAPLMTAGKGSFVDNLINLAGGDNIGRQAIGEWPQYSMEKLLVEDPDVYISTTHSAESVVSSESIKKRENFNSLSAITNDRIYIIEDTNIINRASTRVIHGLIEFVSAIFPELADELAELR